MRLLRLEPYDAELQPRSVKSLMKVRTEGGGCMYEKGRLRSFARSERSRGMVCCFLAVYDRSIDRSRLCACSLACLHALLACLDCSHVSTPTHSSHQDILEEASRKGDNAYDLIGARSHMYKRTDGCAV